MYWHNRAQAGRVEFARREEAVESAKRTVRAAMTFGALYVWHDRQIVALVIRGSRLTDEQLKERHGRFIEVVRV